MTIEEVTVSSRLATQLKEAGYPQESVAFEGWYNSVSYISDRTTCIKRGLEYVAHPTAEEIIRQLPRQISFPNGMKRYLEIMCRDEHYEVRYFGLGQPHEQEFDSSLANAAAKTWLHLKKTNLFPASA